MSPHDVILAHSHVLLSVFACAQGGAVVSEGHVSVASAPCEHEERSVLALPA